MLEVGLTGGIASGKSTVAAMFRELGASLVDSDRLARRAVAPGSSGLARIVDSFGPGVLGPGGGLDRRGLRRRIFSDPAARDRLNAIVHPLVLEMVEAELARLRRRRPGGVTLVDVPLLFEVGWQDRFAGVVLVYAPAPVQMERLMARDQVDEKAARAALAAQMPIEEKRRLAQFVVDNAGSLQETQRQVQAIYTRLREKAAETASR